MSTYNSVEGQSIYDIALQLFGDESRVVELMTSNPEKLNSINNEIIGGTDLSFDPDQNEINQFLTDRKFTIATTNNCDLDGKGFDNGFDLGFN